MEATLADLEKHFHCSFLLPPPHGSPLLQRADLMLDPALTPAELQSGSRYAPLLRGLVWAVRPALLVHIRFLPPPMVACSCLPGCLHYLAMASLLPGGAAALMLQSGKGRGSPSNAAMHRGISMLYPMAKLFLQCLLGRLDYLAESLGWCAWEQAGFRAYHHT